MFSNFQGRMLAIPVLIMCGITLIICIMPQEGCCDLTSITNGRSLDAVHARLQADYNYSDKEGMDIIACYANYQFAPSPRDMGGTARREWLFYDKDDRFLFSLTEVGNRNLILIRMDDKEVLYQYRLPEK